MSTEDPAFFLEALDYLQLTLSSRAYIRHDIVKPYIVATEQNEVDSWEENLLMTIQIEQ